MLLFKIILNSAVSIMDTNIMVFDVSDCYLNTPMKRYTYVKLLLTDIPDKVTKEYRLHKTRKVSANCFVYVKVQKGMYSLSRVNILAQKLLVSKQACPGPRKNTSGVQSNLH